MANYTAQVVNRIRNLQLLSLIQKHPKSKTSASKEKAFPCNNDVVRTTGRWPRVCIIYSHEKREGDEGSQDKLNEINI